MQQKLLPESFIFHTYYLELKNATDNYNCIFKTYKPNRQRGGDILTKDPITNNNFELIYKTRDIDFTLIFTSNETGNVYVKTDVVPGGPGLYLYNFSYRNIRFPLEIYIMNTYSHLDSFTLYDNFGARITCKPLARESIMLILDE